MTTGSAHRPAGRAALRDLEFVLDADLAPDARRVVYTTRRTSAADDTISAWVVAVGDPDGRRELPVDGDPAAPSWSPDGSVVVMTTTVGDTRQLTLVDPEAGTARVLTDFEHGVTGAPAWAPDGSRVAVAVIRGRRLDRDAPYRVDRVPWRLDGLGEVGDLLSDIVAVDVATGAADPLTDGETIDVDPRWSPDGGSVLFVRSHEADDLGPMDHHVVVGPDGETPVAWPGGMAAAGAFADDGHVVSICFRQADRPRGSSVDVYRSGLDGSSDNRTAGLDLGIGASLLAEIPSGIADGGRWVGIHEGDAVVPVLVGGSVQVARVALDGPQRVDFVLDGPRSANPLAIRSGRLLYATSDPNRLPELVVHDLVTGAEQAVTAIGRSVGLRPLKVDRLEAPSPDGTPVEAWFLHPETGEAPHPTVLLIHGGPFAAYGEAMNLNAQHLARAGIGVVLSNPRASLGYGTSFGTATRGAWGTLDQEDLLAVIDAVVGAGLADPDRLGVCGNSYGGYMTSWLIGHTGRFKAAVAQNPVVDFRSFRGASDIGITFTDDVLGGSPVEVPDAYVERSPVTHIHRCVTPTRLIVSEADRRVPPFQGEMLYAALCEAGVPTDMVRLPGASHSGSSGGRPAVRRAEDDAIVEWMVRYLRAGS